MNEYMLRCISSWSKRKEIIIHFKNRLFIDELIITKDFYVCFQEKKAKRDKERDERIAQGDVKEKETARFQERSKLLSLLQPLGFNIKDIHPDGNW